MDNQKPLELCIQDDTEYYGDPETYETLYSR